MANRIQSLFEQLASAGANAAGATGALAAVAAGQVRIRTNFTPEVTVDQLQLTGTTGPDGKPVPSQGASLLNPLVWLRPEFEVPTPAGPVIYAPYGHPDGLWAVRALGLAALAGAGGAFFLGARGIAFYSLLGGAALIVGPTFFGDKIRLLLEASAPSPAPQAASS